MQAEVRCKKVRFASRKEAKRAAKDMTLKMGFRYRTYQCQWCDQYHLTHTEKWEVSAENGETSYE